MMQPGDNQLEHMRATLLRLYQAGLQAVSGRHVVARTAQDITWPQPVYVVAIGKAAAAMLQGLYDAKVPIVRGLLITKYGHADAFRPRPEISIHEAGHPLPDENSLLAGQALLDFIQESPAHSEWLFLLSGGASSLVEVLAEGVTLACLRSITLRLMGEAADIIALNRMRKALSRIKGGRLCAYLGGRRTVQWLISDVPEDDPAIIGSGLLIPQTIQYDWPAQRPPECAPVRLEQVDARNGEAAPETHIVARLQDALQAAADQATREGLPVRVMNQRLEGQAQRAGEAIALELINGPPGLTLYGGETTVTLPTSPGRGGRCQHLALAAALQLEGQTNVALLAAGSDGSDGPGEDAGALVDGLTCQRARQEGFVASRALAAADSGALLAAVGDLVQTGPTGTNVTDLVLALKWT